MALVSVKPKPSLDVGSFIKVSTVDRLTPRKLSRFRRVAVSETNVIKMSGAGSFVSIDILKGIELDSKYKYVTIIGAVISGEWTVPEGCSGGAVISLMDKRMKGFKAGLISELKTKASARRFQVKFVPNYSLFMEDAVRKPWEVYFKLVKVPIEDSYYPLAVEIAVLVEQSVSIIQHGLRATILNRCDGNIEGLDLQLPEAEVNGDFDLFSNESVMKVVKRKTKKPTPSIDKTSKDVESEESEVVV